MTTQELKDILATNGYTNITRHTKKQVGNLTLRIFTTATVPLYVYTSTNDTVLFKIVESPYVETISTKVDHTKISYFAYHCFDNDSYDKEAETSTVEYFLDYEEDHPIYDEVSPDDIRETHSFIWEVISPWVAWNEMENSTRITVKFYDNNGIREFIDHLNAVGWHPAPYTMLANHTNEQIKLLY